MKPKWVSNKPATSHSCYYRERKKSVVLLIRIEKNTILNISFKTYTKIPPTQPCPHFEYFRFPEGTPSLMQVLFFFTPI